MAFFYELHRRRNLVRFVGLTGKGIGALDGRTATRCGTIGADIRASGARADSVFALRFDDGRLFRPFYGEAQPRLLLGPRASMYACYHRPVNG
jgi:hypothetical protein